MDAFELWCWTRLLRVPWTARRSNQSILKKISPEYSLEGLTLKLKIQFFGHLMRRADLLENILMLGEIEGRRRRWWQRMRGLDGIINSMDMSLSKPPGVGDGQGGLACCDPWGSQSCTQLTNWTELNCTHLNSWSHWQPTTENSTGKKSRKSQGVVVEQLRARVMDWRTWEGLRNKKSPRIGSLRVAQ